MQRLWPFSACLPADVVPVILTKTLFLCSSRSSVIMEADFLSMHFRNITYHPRRPHPY